MTQTLGLIAGRGHFPFAIAASLRRQGWRVVAVGFHGETEPDLEGHVDEFACFHLGQVEAILDRLKAAGVRDAVMAGGILKTRLNAGIEALRPDARAISVFTRLRDRKDDSILGALADELASEDITLRSQPDLVPDLFPGQGPLGRVEPSALQLRDIAFGWPIAKTIGGLDVGQSVVIKDRAVMALEAIEGTDAAILRGGNLAGGGGCVVKVAKPAQDLRFDLPTFGTRTIANLAEVKIGCLAFEAGRTVLVDREAVVSAADAHGIAVVGFGPEGPASEESA